MVVIVLEKKLKLDDAVSLGKVFEDQFWIDGGC